MLCWPGCGLTMAGAPLRALGTGLRPPGRSLLRGPQGFLLSDFGRAGSQRERRRRGQHVGDSMPSFLRLPSRRMAAQERGVASTWLPPVRRQGLCVADTRLARVKLPVHGARPGTARWAGRPGP